MWSQTLTLCVCPEARGVPGALSLVPEAGPPHETQVQVPAPVSQPRHIQHSLSGPQQTPRKGPAVQTSVGAAPPSCCGGAGAATCHLCAKGLR